MQTTNNTVTPTAQASERSPEELLHNWALLSYRKLRSPRYDERVRGLTDLLRWLNSSRWLKSTVSERLRHEFAEKIAREGEAR